jgi:hypothetical protein
LVRYQRALRVQARESSSLAPLRCFLRGQGAIRAKEFLITLWKAQITRSTLQLTKPFPLFISQFSSGLPQNVRQAAPINCDIKTDWHSQPVAGIILRQFVMKYDYQFLHLGAAKSASRMWRLKNR